MCIAVVLSSLLASTEARTNAWATSLAIHGVVDVLTQWHEVLGQDGGPSKPCCRDNRNAYFNYIDGNCYVDLDHVGICCQPGQIDPSCGCYYGTDGTGTGGDCDDRGASFGLRR